MLVIQGPGVGTIGGTILEREQEFLFGDGTLQNLPLPVNPNFSVPPLTRSVRLMSSNAQSFDLTITTTLRTYYVKGMLTELAFGSTVGEYITGIYCRITGIGGYVGIYYSSNFRVRNSPREWNVI